MGSSCHSREGHRLTSHHGSQLLYLLLKHQNLLQEGLANANSSARNRYGETCVAAVNQARQQKLNLHSGQKDPNFYYGEAVELDLKELLSNVEKYNGLKVAFNGIVTMNANETAYVEVYDSETDMYYGMSVYYGYGLNGEGVQILNVTVGNPYYNPHVNRPYRKGGYVAPEPASTGLERFEIIEKHIKETFPTLTVVGSGLSYYRKDLFTQAQRQLRQGVCDLVGFGRVTLAYPMFYRDWLNGKFDPKKCCAACSKCTALMRHKCVSGCAVFNDYYKELYKEKVLCKK